MAKLRLFVWTIALWLMPGVLAAQMVEGKSLDDPKTEAEAFDIASRTMSPFCPGRTLADCPSGKATEWRQDIRAMLQEGKSAAEVQRILNARAGTNLSGTPESSLGWMLPVGLCVGALMVLTFVVRRIRSEEEASGQDDTRADDDARDDEDGDDEDEDAARDTARDAAEGEAAAAEGEAGGRDASKRSTAESPAERALEERLRRELGALDD